MTATDVAADAGAGAGNASAPRAPNWTCPFCALLCDGLTIRLEAGGRLRLDIGDAEGDAGGRDCPHAREALDALAPAPDVANPKLAQIDGQDAGLDAAVAEAARRLAGCSQPLFGGLGTDVAGARALYRLAAATGAICDHADGESLMRGVRAQQDRGIFYTTLGEVTRRADLIVCIGTSVTSHYPSFFRRIGVGTEGSPCQRIVFLDADVPAGLPPTVAAETVQASGDLFADLQQLSALVAELRVAGPDESLVSLAGRLRAASYAVLVWESAALPAHGALLVEAANRIVGTLNRNTRAAMFSLGGGDGAYSVNQTFTWLSGLPLRTRIGRDGLEHDPLRFGAGRLLANGAVDGLLWISSFWSHRLPPPEAAGLPRVILGPLAMAERLREADALGNAVFIAVGTPGVNAPGHLFRTDGGIVVPLEPARDDGLPTVAEAVGRIAAAIECAT